MGISGFPKASAMVGGHTILNAGRAACKSSDYECILLFRSLPRVVLYLS